MNDKEWHQMNRAFKRSVDAMIQGTAPTHEDYNEIITGYETAMRAALEEMEASIEWLLHPTCPANVNTGSALEWLYAARETLRAALPDDAPEGEEE